MSNHFHILLEVPPMPEDGIPDAELFERLGAYIDLNLVIGYWGGGGFERNAEMGRSRGAGREIGDLGIRDWIHREGARAQRFFEGGGFGENWDMSWWLA